MAVELFCNGLENLRGEKGIPISFYIEVPLVIKEEMGFKAVIFTKNFKGCQACENFESRGWNKCFSRPVLEIFRAIFYYKSAIIEKMVKIRACLGRGGGKTQEPDKAAEQ